MSFGRYILDDAGEPVLCPDLDKWARWFETAANRTLAQENVAGYRVSTVFLGIDHNWSDRGGPPILYETMIFDPDGDTAFEYQERCASREAALRRHADAVATVLREVARA